MAARVISPPISILGMGGPTYAASIKGWDAIAKDSVNSIDDYIGRLTTEKPFDALIGTDAVYSGMGPARAWSGEEVIEPCDIGFLWTITKQHYFYANACRYTFLANQFDLYNLNARRAEELGISLAHKRQLVFGDFLNGLFTTAWADGVYPFSASHPLDARANNVPAWISGGVQSNLISGALSSTTLLAALNRGRMFVDAMGRPLPASRPIALLVANSKVATARQIINKDLNWQYGTADHNQNPFTDYNLGNDFVVGYPYFNTETKWMVIFSNAKIMRSEKIPMTIRPAKETEDLGLKQQGYFSEAFWLEDWRGIVGGPGA